MEWVKKIDVHVHCVPMHDLPRANGSNYPLPSDLRRMYDQLNIERGILMPPGSAPEGTADRVSQREARLMYEQNPHVFAGWFCNLDPRQGGNNDKTDFGRYLRYYKAHGARGVGEMTANLYLDDPRMMNLFSYCEAEEMPVLIHIGNLGNDYGVVDDLHFPRLEKVLKAFPKLVVIGHSPKFWVELDGDVTLETREAMPQGNVRPGGAAVQLMEQHPNLYCEFSSLSGGNAILRDRKFTSWFLEKFQDRVLYGTDFHDANNLNQYDTYQKVSDFLEELAESGEISREAYCKICRENAIRLLKL